MGLCVAALVPTSASAQVARQAADAIIELDVERGRALLEQAGPRQDLAFERARLALYLGDCEAAQAIMSAPQFAGSEDAAHFRAVAEGCHGATAAGLVLEDEARGIWLRLQDGEDRALAPRLFEVANASRAHIERELGVTLPRPLRIDLVRDLFSLAAVTGLPLTAAETTGTVAVARWGRVTMLSPRAASSGYPWEDTLAHEITHLALSRATRDFAPLWLQEGIAKRLETRWRAPQPFDVHDHHQESRAAQVEGKSVGIQGLGSSIAMLPTPEAASIAFSEVASFMDYWVAHSGVAALQLLLRDLRGVGDAGPNAALLSLSGVTLVEWNERWQRWLEANIEAPKPPPKLPPLEVKRLERQRGEAARLGRLGEVLLRRGHAAAAEVNYLKLLTIEPRDAGVRSRLGRTALAQGEPDRARAYVAELSQVRRDHAHWWALRARFALGTGTEEPASLAAARAAYLQGIAVDPLSELVACAGHVSVQANPQTSPSKDPQVRPGAAPGAPSGVASATPQAAPSATGAAGSAHDVAYRELCEAARRFGRD